MLIIGTNQLLNNRYRLQSRIGSGGFSVVWKAIDIKSGDTPVAVKIFLPDKGADSSIIDMFREEFELTKNLNDNRLVKNTDYFVCDDKPCLVMVYCPGGALYEKIRKSGSLPEKEIAKIIYQICGALNYLHAQETPVIHLDIKPENILIDYSGNYLLADFGISQQMRSTLLRASNTKGETFAYSSPERSETRKLGTSTDIFALGVLIYELCTGVLPWGGMGGSAMVIGLPKPELPDGYTHRLENIMHACLDRYPQYRPTAKTLEDLSRKYLDHGHWDELQATKSEEKITIPTSSENLEKAISALEFESFIKKTDGNPSKKVIDSFFFELNKSYGNINRDSFDKALHKAFKVNSRKTNPKPLSEHNLKENYNKKIFYIAGGILGITLIIMLIWIFLSYKTSINNKNNSQQTLAKIKNDSSQVADSTNLADSLAKIAYVDSIVITTDQANESTSKPAQSTKQQVEPKQNNLNPNGTFIDTRDGHTYKWIKIGYQIWMAENLNYAIKNGSLFYDDNYENGGTYGRLYNWSAAKKACPAGWHLPSDAEWTKLINFLGGLNDAVMKMKSKNGWVDYNNKSCNGTNECGFTALPGGARFYREEFCCKSSLGIWWSSTSDGGYAWNRSISCNDDYGVSRSGCNQNYYLSVRCVRN
ncbi:MAG: protein kinase domain-containing protein [Bacteroidales bacterium]